MPRKKQQLQPQETSTTLRKPLTAEEARSNPYVQGVFFVKYFPSVNSMYILAHRRKCMAPECVAIRDHAFSQMSTVYTGQEVPTDAKIAIELGFYLSHSINRRDLDNCLKFTIDTLSKFYNFNDNRVFSIITYKRLLTDAKNELLYYKIYEDIKAGHEVSLNELVPEGTEMRLWDR